ncbi:helix-turn-helix transcriptional regulator [Flavobacterium sp. IMCC34852]|uniref:Helix-turn-helix transcriptional regulator n=1 Tax=Flavobacterium rivulicola TaxID=2732161 RepID=A0A7Y3R9D6_9FLAO|nr:helix-turn-helix domain-containing protein [Flavobacterium sp. IMCC34852]NNT71965.1 helix-turn-helix transcriptional regulator [Flavobacterium sp. IMCC34852]
MLFQFGFYSSLLLITFSQGIIYSILLLKKAILTEGKSNYWLSFFIFLCSLYIAPWMLGFAGWYDNQPYRDILFYVPFQHLLLIGPVIYFYTQSLLNPSFQLTRKNFLHFIPGIGYLFYILGLWIYDKFIVNDYYFYKDGLDKDFESWYQNIGLISMMIYFLVSIRYYNLYRKLMFQVVSYADTVLFKWIKTYLYAFLIMLSLPLVLDIVSSFYPDIDSYTGTWWFFLFFSIIMYYIAIIGYSNPIVTKIPFEISVFPNQPALLLQPNQSEEVIIDIEHETFTEQESPETKIWKNKIETLITGEKLYQNPELTLTDLAKKLNTNASVISKAVNQGFRVNFNDFINQYRIDAVKKAFEAGEHKKSTLLGIAFDCGFNSKATFNRAFKKNTGLSPKEFLNKI